jgi:hypothetical protein
MILFRNIIYLNAGAGKNLLGESGDVRDMEKSLSFGVSFIFTLFLSSLSGYYLGKHFLGLSDTAVFVLTISF